MATRTIAGPEVAKAGTTIDVQHHDVYVHIGSQKVVVLRGINQCGTDRDPTPPLLRLIGACILQGNDYVSTNVNTFKKRKPKLRTSR